MEKIRVLCKTKFKQIIPVIHFLISFIWERSIFVFSGNWDCWFTDIRDGSTPGGRSELITVYIVSRIIGFFIIKLIWHIVFCVKKKEISLADKWMLGIIFMIGLAVGILMFPGMFSLGYDSYTNYLFARRFLPTYWHSIYTGMLYCACLMVIPHPAALFIFQWLFFWSAVSYFYLVVRRTYGNSRTVYIPLLLFLLPESYYLTFNSYRNNYYTILIIFYIVCIFDAVKTKEYDITPQKALFFAALTSVVMVWRSEGILFGVGGLFVYTVYVMKTGKGTWKRTLMIILSSVLLVVGLNRLQSTGEKKYYGRDYMILNTTNVLYSIFNDPNADLSYMGASDDLDAIERIVPVEVLREYGMDGYRNHNWSEGHVDFNQTLADDLTADAYMSAYYRIIAHNFSDYLDVQINSFYSALQIPGRHKTYTYNGDHYVEQDGFIFNVWQEGEAEIKGAPFTLRWEENKMRFTLFVFVSKLMDIWTELLVYSGINQILHVLAITGDCIFMVWEIFRWIHDRRKIRFIFIIPLLLIVGECLAVLLFMPEGRPAYMYPVLFASYTLLFIYRQENSLGSLVNSVQSC